MYTETTPLSEILSLIAIAEKGAESNACCIDTIKRAAGEAQPCLAWRVLESAIDYATYSLPLSTAERVIGLLRTALLGLEGEITHTARL